MQTFPGAAGRSMLTGATRLTAIFGDPVAHSLSPAMHNAAYGALKLDRAYVAMRVEAADLRRALSSIAALKLLGANLTVPHKEAAARMLAGRLSAEARRLGAVNCLINRRGVLFGDNTDARGLEGDLCALGAVMEGAVIIVGAGGGAVAAALAVLRLGAREIVLANRTVARARRLAARLGAKKIEARGLDALTDSGLLARAALVINATPMGLKTKSFTALDYSATPPECLFYDLLYAARPTAFLRPAAALNRRIADGAGMLVNQGELAFKLFNGFPPPKGVMRHALLERLDRSDS